MHHWEAMICRQRAPERANVKPKPPTLTDPVQGRTESQREKLWSSRDMMCSCCSFISPSGESGALFDIRPTCSSDEHKSGVKSVFESPLWLSVLLCLTRNPPCIHMDAHTLPLYLSLSIDCCNQTACCSQVVRECRAIFHSLQPMLGGILPFSAQPGHKTNEVTGKRRNKSRTQKHDNEKQKKNTTLCSKRVGQTCFDRLHVGGRENDTEWKDKVNCEND